MVLIRRSTFCLLFFFICISFCGLVQCCDETTSTTVAPSSSAVPFADSESPEVYSQNAGSSSTTLAEGAASTLPSAEESYPSHILKGQLSKDSIN